MGIAVPITLFFLLGLQRIPQLLTIATVTFLSWCVADFLAIILSKPRLQNRSPGGAIRDEWERKTKE
jgi:hypothetical protein